MAVSESCWRDMGYEDLYAKMDKFFEDICEEKENIESGYHETDYYHPYGTLQQFVHPWLFRSLLPTG